MVEEFTKCHRVDLNLRWESSREESTAIFSPVVFALRCGQGPLAARLMEAGGVAGMDEIGRIKCWTMKRTVEGLAQVKGCG